MSELLKKHKESCEAAIALIHKKLFAPAVHCSYYSCIQLIKHIFLYEAPAVTSAQLDDAMNAQGGGGTHNYLRREMKKKLLQRGLSRTQADEFANDLLGLKQVRVEADYNDASIGLCGKPGSTKSVRRNKYADKRHFCNSMMNTAKAYINKTLDKLSEQFPTTLIYYAFSPQEKTHIIDMHGSAIEKLTANDWVAVYGDLVDEFENKFVNDSLLFARRGSLVRLNAAKGATYCSA